MESHLKCQKDLEILFINDEENIQINADANDFKTELEFPLIGDLEFFLNVVRNNMRRFSIDWEVGNFPANTETKSLTFSSDNCLSALQRICQEYKVEFWIKQENGKFKIHTGAFGATLPITLEYGKGKGLYSLSRKSVNENDVVSRMEKLETFEDVIELAEELSKYCKEEQEEKLIGYQQIDGLDDLFGGLNNNQNDV